MLFSRKNYKIPVIILGDIDERNAYPSVKTISGKTQERISCSKALWALQDGDESNDNFGVINRLHIYEKLRRSTCKGIVLHPVPCDSLHRNYCASTSGTDRHHPLLTRWPLLL